MKRKALIVIAGPTGVGKTALAVELATHWKTEIVSADSRQIFRELEIGTAKPSEHELTAVRHHFIGTQSIHDAYDAGKYGREALACIHDLFKTHDFVILCGGSGLYSNAVCDGFDEMPDVAPAVRQELILNYSEKGLAWLQEEVREKDPLYFSVVDQRNPQRLMRALELIYHTGQTMTELRRSKKIDHPFGIVKVGVDLDRNLLYERIDQRVESMLARGLEAEARRYFPYRDLNALQTVGYTELFGYFDGEYDREEAVRRLKRNTRHYAKRQLTWFRRDAAMQWFKPDQLHDIIHACEQSQSMMNATAE